MNWEEKKRSRDRTAGVIEVRGPVRAERERLVSWLGCASGRVSPSGAPVEWTETSAGISGNRTASRAVRWEYCNFAAFWEKELKTVLEREEEVKAEVEMADYVQVRRGNNRTR